MCGCCLGKGSSYYDSNAWNLGDTISGIYGSNGWTTSHDSSYSSSKFTGGAARKNKAAYSPIAPYLLARLWHQLRREIRPTWEASCLREAPDLAAALRWKEESSMSPNRVGKALMNTTSALSSADMEIAANFKGDTQTDREGQRKATIKWNRDRSCRGG